ncbi:unnamed protein product [Rotaria magnacalcarata]|uniref:G domain-containing protein n=1 Tax=Rotaria magnacalcarata TaxID=392030 RepID=A0A815PZ83_9BILA|nr:unnamed protein product [Rotaria magnacalcarata]CAF1455463.1 unnamed protein product [Rotaria magnacalcarata]CAF2144598.1 unnamed protein product [Rotaria magnacalcarata]CAF4045494.1 unnamed protein product [Rotaria magnacalcarata]CAF4086886.1 unnamed protein product [Rotaria magnacalcarata]
MSETVKESNILICGSSRVGKTSLINAICQKELSRSNTGLNSDTKSIDKYSSRTIVGDVTYETNFWDTPGIESWNENEIRSYMASLIEKTHPICMIYCASPGSFAVLDHVAWMVAECYSKHIFCALVCTNMWAGRNRQSILDEFCKLLNTVHPQIKPTKEEGITYYDRVALVTMVNSIEHVDEDFGVTKPASGINELIFGIAKCLERDFMIAWFRIVYDNKSFWTTMSSKLSTLLHVPYEKFNIFYQHAENFLSQLLDFMEFDDDNTYFPLQTTREIDPHTASSFNTNKESLFDDAEMVEIPESPKSQKKLLFTLKSKDMLVQLNNALIPLGAKKIRNFSSNTTDESIYSARVEFADTECLKAIYDIWQVMHQTQVDCTIVDDSSAD